MLDQQLPSRESLLHDSAPWVAARKLAWLAATVCLGLLATGYVLEFFFGLHPCPLCLVQRGVLYILGLSFLITGWLANGERSLTWARLWLILLGLTGVALASRHIWIQKHPELAIPSCFGSLGDMFAELPIVRFLQNLLNGTVECSKIDWTFLTLTIPQWTCVWFVSLTILAFLLPRYARR